MAEYEILIGDALVPARVEHILGHAVPEGEAAPNVSNDFGGWFD